MDDSFGEEEGPRIPSGLVGPQVALLPAGPAVVPTVADKLIDVYLEPVTGTTVGMAGNCGDTLGDASHTSPDTPRRRGPHRTSLALGHPLGRQPLPVGVTPPPWCLQREAAKRAAVTTGRQA